jgi:hypothetical protein
MLTFLSSQAVVAVVAVLAVVVVLVVIVLHPELPAAAALLKVL